MDQSDKYLSPESLEKASQNAFARLRSSDLEPSPFFSRRVLAQIPKSKPSFWNLKTEVWLWRVVAGVAVAACLALVWTRGPLATDETRAYAALQPYVIHVDLQDAKLVGARMAEVELPEGVSFYSEKHPELAQERKLRLPVPEEIEGRSRLPFVVRADRPGIKELKMRILGADNEVLQERAMSVNFKTSIREG